jgi:actin beta/gamma 1
MVEENQILVVDTGSGIVKAGFSGEDAPRSMFPNIIGIPKDLNDVVGEEYKEEYFGDEALQRRGILEISYPMENGLIRDFDGIEKIISRRIV